MLGPANYACYSSTVLLTSKIIKHTIDNSFNSTLIYHEITYEKTPLLPFPSFERSGRQYHRSPTSLLAAISNHRLATLPDEISVFKSHM